MNAPTYKSTSQTGEVWEYSDMANPGTRYTVLGDVTRTYGPDSNPYQFTTTERVLMNEEGEYSEASMNGVRWVKVADAPK